MFKIDGTTIYLTRGDSALLQVSATIDGGTSQYTFQVGDKLKFTVKRDALDASALVSKETTVSTAGTVANIQIDPADTASLSFGPYVYDIQLTKVNGWVDTIITKSIIEIGEEIG